MRHGNLFIAMFLVVALGSGHAFAAAQVEETRYVILLDNGTRLAGNEVDRRFPNGETKVHYVFKDNGRGPEFDESFRLASDGSFSEYRVKGHSTFGSLFDERFSVKGRRATWKSDAEQGSTDLRGGEFYFSVNGGSMAAQSVLLNAALASASGSVALLPGGQLSARAIENRAVKMNGTERTVTLVAIAGIGLQPSFIWICPDERAAVVPGKPAPVRGFALFVPGYLTLIEDGWQSVAEELLDRQKKAEASELRDMAHTLRHPLPGLSVIRNARVFDSEKAQLGGASDVYILRGKIAAILPAGSPSVAVDQEIDAAGRVLLPGLFDMHGHVSRWDGGLHLGAGVTSVRDMGNDNDDLQMLLDEVAAGELLHSQVVPAGFLEGEGENSASQGFHVHDLAGAQRAIDWYVAHGYPQLKIYNSFPKEILRDTIAYAHGRGMRVSGHIPVFLRAQDAVEQGYDEIQHINQVLLNFLVTPTTDTRTLDRFYLPAEKVADLDFDSQPVQAFIGMLKQKQTVIDPTISAFDFITQQHGEILSIYRPFIDHMPLTLQRGARVAQMKIPDAKTAARYLRSYQKMVDFTVRMHRAGIPIVAGTDDIPGFVLHSELEGYVRGGLTPAQVLQIATWNGARYSRTLHERGSIAVGKLADLILVDGNPLENIADIRKMNLVITQGAWYAPAEIHRRMGIKPFVEQVIPVKKISSMAKSDARD